MDPACDLMLNGLYETADTVSIVPGFTFMEKFPLASATVADLVPLIEIEALGMGAPPLSTILPEIVGVWADTRIAMHTSTASSGSNFLMCVNFGL